MISSLEFCCPFLATISSVSEVNEELTLYCKIKKNNLYMNILFLQNLLSPFTKFQFCKLYIRLNTQNKTLEQ